MGGAQSRYSSTPYLALMQNTLQGHAILIDICPAEILVIMECGVTGE
jgi:hypothetical protein